MKISFIVFGNPIPKARPRRGQNGSWYTPKKTANYERQVMGRALGCVPLQTRMDLRAHKGDISVDLRFFRENRRACDADNLAKCVCDALNGVLWRDDRQIKKLSVSLGVDARSPRVEVDIETR